MCAGHCQTVLLCPARALLASGSFIPSTAITSSVLTAEGLGGSEGAVSLVRHGHFIPKVQNETSGPDAGEAKISMRELTDDPATPALLVVNFPPGEGWKTMTVALTW